MLPPPAPIVSMSRPATRSGMPSISRSKASVGAPSLTKDTSVLVPPMSKVTSEDSPRCRPSQTAPITPALGPDSTVRTGARTASSREMVPPLDWLM